MLSADDLEKFSYITTIIDNEPCYLFLYANYYEGINLYKKALEGNLIYATLLVELNSALDVLTKTERYIFTMEIMYDVRMDKKNILDEAKKRLQSFLATPSDVMDSLMGEANEEEKE